MHLRRAVISQEARLLALMTIGIGILGIVDASSWNSLRSPTLAYRPAVLFGFVLLLGWRALAWSVFLFAVTFAVFLGWQGAVFVAPTFLLGQAVALVLARRISKGEPWLLRERSTLAFLAVAAVAPALPALLNPFLLRMIGVSAAAGVTDTLDSWLRGVGGILALVPAMLVYGSWMTKWVGQTQVAQSQPSLTRRDSMDLVLEVAAWTATLWLTVEFKAQYGINVTYLTFMPPLGLALFRGMRLAALALAANAVIATTLWSWMHWARVLSMEDLRLLIAIYSVIILVLAAVVEERQRHRTHVEKLLTAEIVLRESERLFRTLANSAPAMIWLTGPDGLITFGNKRWLEFTRCSSEEKSRDGWASDLHPDDVERSVANFDSAFEARRCFQMEYRVRRADGEYRWILDNGMPHYREGDFAGYIGSRIDITEQKHADEQLRSNQIQLMDSQRLAKVGSWELDVATRRTRWSDEWYRVVGVSKDVDTNFGTFLRCVHPKDRENVREAEKRSLTADAPFGFEFRIVRPDGEVRFIRAIVEAIKNDEGVVVRLTGAAQDVTEQVKATALLRESEAQLKAAERITHLGHWSWDIKTNRVTWSEGTFRIMGQPPDYEPSYELYRMMVAPGDREQFEEWSMGCIREKRGGMTEHRVIRPDGEKRTVVVRSEVLLDEDSSPAVIFGAVQDVTEARRTMEESIARQKLESLGTLAGGIAHDFNNLLGAVLAQTKLAMSELEAGSHPEGELDTIRNVAIRGSEIVRQLMIYAGQESDVLEAVDVSAHIEGMLDLLKVAVSRQAALVTNLSGDLPAVRAHPAELSQIVMNLVVNASEALDRDGVIRVTTDRITVSRTEPVVSGVPVGDYVRLEVYDSGSGIPPEMQAMVFDPFFTTKFSGRGLGLAVVQGIVRSRAGTIQVESEPGMGTTFRVLLPCVETPWKADAGRFSPVAAAAPSARRDVVLVVEDEEPLLLAVAKMLRRSGFEVLEAANGFAAVDLLRTRGGEIDLIVLDLTIPGKGSQDVVAEAARVRPEVKVILTSAYSEEVARIKINSPLVSGFIRKPFKLGHLVDTLRSASSALGFSQGAAADRPPS